MGCDLRLLAISPIRRADLPRPRHAPRSVCPSVAAAACYNPFRLLISVMPRRLGRKLMLSITVIVIIVAAVSGLVNVKTEEQQLLKTMILGADQLSKGITSAIWHAMLDDRREAAYEMMRTIALQQGIDRI